MAFDLSAVGRAWDPVEFTYEARDVMLYALGIGARAQELDYLYEGRGPKVYPSFAVVPVMKGVFECLAALQGPLEKLLHSAQKITLHGPLPPAATLLTTAKLEGVYDLKRMTQAIVRTQTRVKGSESVLFETEWQIVYVGEGGMGSTGPRPKDERALVPEREPDFRVSERTLPEQALLYRLSGDYNPLHADPAFPLVERFQGRPILHGLCSYGHLARALVREACGGDSARLRTLVARFSAPVWPGETLCTEGWYEGDRVLARTVVEERNREVVLSGAVATLNPAEGAPPAGAVKE